MKRLQPESVTSIALFTDFLRELHASWEKREADTLEELSPEDLEGYGAAWGVTTLSQFLDAMVRVSEKSGVKGPPAWSDVAKLLDAARKNGAKAP